MLYAMTAPEAEAMVCLEGLWDGVSQSCQGFEMSLKSLRVHHHKPPDIDFEASLEGRFFWERLSVHWQRFDRFDGNKRGNHLHIVLFGAGWEAKKPKGDWVQMELSESVGEETLTLWHEANPRKVGADPHPTHLNLIKGDEEKAAPLQVVIRYYRLNPDDGRYAHWTRWQRHGGSPNA